MDEKPKKYWNEKLSAESRKSFVRAMKEAEKFGHQQMGVAHVVLGILNFEDIKVYSILQALNIDAKEIKGGIEQKIQQYSTEQKVKIPINSTPALMVLMDIADKYAEKIGASEICPKHIVYASTKVLEDKTAELKPEELAFCELLKKYGLEPAQIDEQIKKE